MPHLTHQQLRDAAYACGFANIGVAHLPMTPATHNNFTAWLAQNFHGAMAWMAARQERRADPRQILPGAQSLICVTLNYFTPHAQSDDPQRGRISRYAWGDDYHAHLLAKLETLLTALRALDPTIDGKTYVDTGAIFEKPWAARAGLGFQGKHTNLIDPHRGSWFFLGEIVTNVEMVDHDTHAAPQHTQTRAGAVTHETRDNIRTPAPSWRSNERPDTPPQQSRCGSCARCIDVCPTRAIVAPYQLDARRCISYLTIEHKGSIPEELRPLLGNHIYGCDLCQAVCPWNRFATPTPDPAFEPRAGALNPRLADLMYLTDVEFRTRFANSPIKRLGRVRLQRNVAIALGNSGDLRALPALTHGVHCPDVLVHEHAAWGVAQITARKEFLAVDSDFP